MDSSPLRGTTYEWSTPSQLLPQKEKNTLSLYKTTTVVVIHLKVSDKLLLKIMKPIPVIVALETITEVVCKPPDPDGIGKPLPTVICLQQTECRSIQLQSHHQPFVLPQQSSWNNHSRPIGRPYRRQWHPTDFQRGFRTNHACRHELRVMAELLDDNIGFSSTMKSITATWMTCVPHFFLFRILQLFSCIYCGDQKHLMKNNWGISYKIATLVRSHKNIRLTWYEKVQNL